MQVKTESVVCPAANFRGKKMSGVKSTWVRDARN